MSIQNITFVAVRISQKTETAQSAIKKRVAQVLGDDAYITNARSAGKGSYLNDPYNYFKIGTLQAPQNKFYINSENEICRELYGKEVVQKEITKEFQKWLKK